MSNEPAMAEDRRLASGFEPETILPSQLLDASHLGAARQPEKRLMLAVLEDGIATFQRTLSATTRRARREFDEVRAWIASDDTAWPYAFLNVCHVLGFDPDYLRAGLTRWLELYHQVARANGGEPDAGRRLLSWAQAAGFDQVTASASTWCFATPADLAWWSETWAERLRRSDFARQAIEHGLSDSTELAEVAQGWLGWGQLPDAWFCVLHGEILCRR